MHRFYESNKMLQKVQSLSLGPIASDKLVTHLVTFPYGMTIAAYLYASLLFGGNKDNFFGMSEPHV